MTAEVITFLNPRMSSIDTIEKDTALLVEQNLDSGPNSIVQFYDEGIHDVTPASLGKYWGKIEICVLDSSTTMLKRSYPPSKSTKIPRFFAIYEGHAVPLGMETDERLEIHAIIFQR